MENAIPIYQTARRHVPGTHLSVNDHSFSPKNMYLIYFLSMMRYCQYVTLYRGADKSLARPTSRSILFHGENISFDASLVIYIYIYIYSTNIPPIMIINRIYETQSLLSL